MPRPETEEFLQMFVVRVMFDWGGGCLWCGDNNTRARFDVGPLDEKLALTPALRARLHEMSTWHDTKLNWSSPSSPTLWSAAEEEHFAAAAADVVERIRAELGPTFAVHYIPR